MESLGVQAMRESAEAVGWIVCVTGVASAAVLVIAAAGSALTEAFWFVVTLGSRSRR